jgi:TonB-dependent SusC/RagA subfamily outer membrane receptor
MVRIFLFIILTGISAACTTTNKTQQQSDNSNATRSVGVTESINEVDSNNPTLELADILRRVPGVQVTGPKSNPMVRIRSSTNVTNNVEPLYVIDKYPVGNSYEAAAQQVDVNDIKTVRVLKDVSSTSMYGLRGANGVIVIITKKK